MKFSAVSIFLPTFIFLLIFSMFSCFEEEVECGEGQVYNSIVNNCVIDNPESDFEGCFVEEEEGLMYCIIVLD